jgi:hypothetical protein
MTSGETDVETKGGTLLYSPTVGVCQLAEAGALMVNRAAQMPISMLVTLIHGFWVTSIFGIIVLSPSSVGLLQGPLDRFVFTGKL